MNKKRADPPSIKAAHKFKARVLFQFCKHEKLRFKGAETQRSKVSVRMERLCNDHKQLVIH
jgi:hypothetical protein